MRLHIPISSLAAPRGGNLANDLTTADAHLAPVLPGKGALVAPFRCVHGIWPASMFTLARGACCLLGPASGAVVLNPPLPIEARH